MKRSFAIALLTLLTLPTLIMCRPSVGTFAPNAFRHPEYPLHVRYHDAASQALMPADWELDNFNRFRGRLQAKTGAEYETRLYADTDGDGTSDDLGTFKTYDLKFIHRRNAGVIWIRTIPIEQKHRERELRVMADGIVESFAGGGYDLVEIEGSLRRTTTDRRYAAKLLSRGDGSLAGRDAHAITVDIANLDQRRVDPESVEARMMLVLVRSGFEFKLPGSFGKRTLPVLLLAAYVNSPADFDASLTEFHGLLDRVVIHGSAGFRIALPAADDKPDAAPVGVPVEPAPAAPSDDGGTHDAGAPGADRDSGDAW